tara:strand:- start:134 stop:550 length:417 start_codon:yes stop_codon:yes gene_type:complete
MGRVFFDTRKNIVDVSAAKTLLPSDSGSVFMINQASAYAITLPNASDAQRGWNAEFIIGTANTNAVTIEATDSDGNNIHGHSIDGEDGAAQTVTEGTGVDVITFISGATKGDRVSLMCDGVSYYVFGLAADKAHITLT